MEGGRQDIWVTILASDLLLIGSANLLTVSCFTFMSEILKRISWRSRSLKKMSFNFTWSKSVCTWHVTAMGCWLLTGTGVAWCLLWGGGQTTSQPHDSAHLSSSVSSKGSHGWKQSHSDPSRSGSCPERKVSSLGWVGCQSCWDTFMEN